MGAMRVKRRLSIWDKVEKCEKSLERIHAIDQQVDRMIKIERLVTMKEKLLKNT